METKCDVLYLHATKNPAGEDCLKFSIMPMGIIGILNGLRQKGVQVIGMNYAMEKKADPDFDLYQTLSQMDYRIFMVDLHWYEHCYGAMFAAEQSKKAHPEVPVVIGGYTTTIYAPEILENFPCVDYAVTGDSELPTEMLTAYLLGKGGTLEEVPNLYYRRGGEVVSSEKTWVQTELDSIDVIPVDFFRHAEDIPHLGCNGVGKGQPNRWIEIARGCKFNCAYCCGAKKNMKALFRRCNILLRSPEKVAMDFKRLADDGITYISPSHDFQMFGKAYYRKVFAQIRKLGIRPGLYLECFQLPTRDFLEDVLQTFDPAMTDIVLSPISGNEELRRINGKMFSNEELFETLAFLIANKLPMQLYYTENLIGETEEQFLETYFQIRYVHDVLGLRKKNLFYQRVVMDPLAGMREFPNTNVTLNTFMDYYRYCQIPTGNIDYTGFTDNGQMPVEQKRAMFESVVGK